MLTPAQLAVNEKFSSTIPLHFRGCEAVIMTMQMWKAFYIMRWTLDMAPDATGRIRGGGR
jgi:hypothetical protein